MADDVLKKFGRYFLLDQIAAGGMGAIYRARLAGPDGAGRLLVIKRLITGFDETNEYVQMFKSEIKVTMGFNHPNVVQLYDFGEEERQPYIAMEFVEGKTLRQIQTRFQEQKKPFPAELAAYAIEQAASGLHYAHVFKDKMSGEPLNIVHRDISPQNILVSYEGNVKVIDFGIAKAATNTETTRAGIIKGKISYLSPEQINGDVLDGRSDQFALGICLWELLVGKKLFSGESDLAILKQIESCNSHVKPPSTFNPNVPKELDYIVLKTLAKQRDKRFTNCAELQRSLHKFLYSYNPEFDPSDLSIHVKDLFKVEIQEDRKKMQRLSEKAEQLLTSSIQAPSAPTQEDSDIIDPADLKRPPPPTPAKAPPRSEATVIELKPQEALAPIDFEKPNIGRNRTTGDRAAGGAGARAAQQSSIQFDRKTPPNARQTASYTRHTSVAVKPADDSGGGLVKLLGMATVATLGVGILGPVLGVEIPVISPILTSLMGGTDAQLDLQGSAQDVTVTLNGAVVSRGLPARLRGVPVGTPFKVSVAGPQGKFEQEVVIKKGEHRGIPVVFMQDAALGASSPDSARGPANTDSGSTGVSTGPSISLRLNLVPGGSQTLVSLNGRAVSSDNPIVTVPLDSPLELIAERNGFKQKRLDFTITSAQASGFKEWLQDVVLEPLHFGFLTIFTTPSSQAHITVDGSTWVRQTPVELEKVPVGNYTIRLVNPDLVLETTVQRVIGEGKSVTVNERLTPK